MQLEQDGFIGAFECGYNLDKEEVDFASDTWEEFYDDISGALLDSALVGKAREEELKFVRDFGVYTKVPAYEAVGHPLISTRWLDINKGDARTPFYRSRLVCREFKSSDPFLEGTFAATPPGEALKFLLSLAMTKKEDGKKFKKLLILDVSRAHSGGYKSSLSPRSTPASDAFEGVGCSTAPVVPFPTSTAAPPFTPAATAPSAPAAGFAAASFSAASALPAGILLCGLVRLVSVSFVLLF